MTSSRPLLIVQTGRTHDHIRERLGDFDDWIAAGLRAGGAEVSTYDALSHTPPPAPETLAGIVLTGSHAMVSEREPWSEALVPWLQAAVQRQTPVLGICYGHQLLAHALGGEVGHHPDGVEIGTVRVQRHAAAQTDPLLGELPDEFDARPPTGSRCAACHRARCCWRAMRSSRTTHSASALVPGACSSTRSSLPKPLQAYWTAWARRWRAKGATRRRSART